MNESASVGKLKSQQPQRQGNNRDGLGENCPESENAPPFRNGALSCDLDYEIMRGTNKHIALVVGHQVLRDGVESREGARPLDFRRGSLQRAHFPHVLAVLCDATNVKVHVGGKKA